MTSGPNEVRGAGRFVVADPLRALGAFGVFVFHCGALAGIGVGTFEHAPWNDLHRLPIRLIGSLNIGVWIFFALSGYLLGRPFIAAYIEQRPAPAVGAYLRNRVLRLGPGMLGIFVITLVVAGRNGSAWDRVAAIPLLVQVYFPSPLAHDTLAHYWTLDNEAVFYLLLPLMMLAAIRWAPSSWSPATRRRALLIALAAIAIGSAVLSQVQPAADSDRRQWFPMIVSAFTPGLALAVLSTCVPERVVGPRGVRAAAWLLIASIIPLGYWVIKVADQGSGLRNLAGCAAAGLIVGAALIRQWSHEPRRWRVLDNRPMQWLGKRSYSFYLIHLLVIVELVVPLHRTRNPSGFVIYLLVGFVFLIPLTALSYELLEKPFLARRKAWRPALDPLPEPADEDVLTPPVVTGTV